MIRTHAAAALRALARRLDPPPTITDRARAQAAAADRSEPSGRRHLTPVDRHPSAAGDRGITLPPGGRFGDRYRPAVPADDDL